MSIATIPDHFRDLLRRHRVAAGLTQEALAERAGLSTRGIQNLEHGVRRPYRDTLERLTNALALQGADRDLFHAAGQPLPRLPSVPGNATPQKAIPRHNLPVALTSFIGRDRELAQLRLTIQEGRAATLTGVGGCGKTRLSLQVAAGALPMFPDGVWMVELAPLSDQTLVSSIVASALEVREAPKVKPRRNPQRRR